MGQLEKRDIAHLLKRLLDFAAEYPSSPCKDAADTLSQLFRSYERLASAPKRMKTRRTEQRTRPRRKTPTFPKGTPAHVRVLSNIHVDEETGCWVWCGAGTPDHGTILGDNRKNTYVHRVMYEHHFKHTLAKGEIVRHTCDNGFCANPAHLQIGSQRENVRDSIKRGRFGTSQLTQEQAKDIFLRYSKGESAVILSREYRMSPQAIRQVGTKFHRYLLRDPEVKAIKRKFGSIRRATLDEDKVRAIRTRLENGEAATDLAEEYGVDVSNIFHIKAGTRWGWVK